MEEEERERVPLIPLYNRLPPTVDKLPPLSPPALAVVVKAPPPTEEKPLGQAT